MTFARFFRIQRRALCTLLVLAVALPGGAAAQTETWMTRVIDLNIDYHEGGVLVLNDGSYAIAGYHRMEDGTEVTRVAKLTAFDENSPGGELEWAMEYPFGRAAAFDYIDNGIPGEHGFLVVAESYSRGSVWVARLDGAGNIVQERTLNLYMNFAKVIGNSAYLATENFNDVEAGLDGVVVVKLNLDTFAIEWSKSIQVDASYLRVRSVEEGRNGGLLVMGWSSPFDESLDTFVLELTAGGALQSVHTVGRLAEHDKARDVAVLADGSLVLAGDGTNPATGDNYDVWVAKINTDWSIGWQLMFEAPDTEWCNAVTVLEDDSIVVGATARTWSPNGEYDFWGIRIKDKNTGPVVKWQKRYWTLERDEAYDIASTPDGGFIFAGDYNAFPGLDGSLLVKANVRGNVEAVNNAGEIIDCPCKTRTPAPAVGTDAVISDHLSTSQVADYSVTIDYPEIAADPVVLDYDRICN